MIQLNSTNVTLTADGEYQFPALPVGAEKIIEVGGTYGGGTVTIGFSDSAGAFASVRDGNGTAITSATGSRAWRVTVPRSGVLAVKVQGATTPSLKVSAT